MFTNTKAFSSFSVNDLGKAKEFYGEKLGLKIRETPEGLEMDIAGAYNIFVYPKKNHTPASFTILNFPVPNIDEVVDKLTSIGIRFEQFEGEMQTDKKGIFRGNPGPKIAWFKDPAGNYLSVLEAK